MINTFIAARCAAKLARTMRQQMRRCLSWPGRAKDGIVAAAAAATETETETETATATETELLMAIETGALGLQLTQPPTGLAAKKKRVANWSWVLPRKMSRQLLAMA